MAGQTEKKNTPLKINMEPNNYPIEKQIHFPNLHFLVPAVHFPGCTRTLGLPGFTPTWTSKTYDQFLGLSQTPEALMIVPC